MKCLNCGLEINNNLKISEIFLFKAKIPNYICQLCRSQLAPLIGRNNCPRCDKPDIGTICRDCLMWEKKYRIINCHQALFEYNQRSEEHTSELQSRFDLVCRLLLE